MSKVALDQIKKLRSLTRAGVMDCRKALEASQGDFKKAQVWLYQKGVATAEKRASRETTQGLVYAYTHAEGKIVAVVELLSESDFVAKTKEFNKLAHELAMQVAAMNPKDVKALLKQPWIRDEKRTVDSLIKELIGTTGENIQVGKIGRFELGRK